MIEAELALRAEDRERAGLADLGPGALELAAAMDASVARVLAQIRADAAEAAAVAAAVPVEEATPISSPLKSGLAGISRRVPSPGFNSMMVWATLLTSLGDFAQSPISATHEGTPETVQVGGSTGTVTTTVTVNAVVSGSRLSVDLTFKTKGQLVNSATGAIVYSIDSTATGHVDVDFCPDAGGNAPAHVKLTSTETYSQGGGGGRSISRDMSADVGITVGDDAHVIRVEGSVQGSEESSGGGSAGGDATSRTSSDNIANDGSGHRLPDVPRNIQLGGENSTVDEQVRMWGTTNLFMETTVAAAAKEAEKLWRSGKCVELIVDPGTRDVQPDEIIDVTAKLKHLIEGNELDKPVEAILTGVKSIEPADEKQPAPATVTYTAGPNDGDIGKIAFKSVSNRGIAEKTVTFTVRAAAWDVTFTGTDTEVFALVSNSFTVELSGLTIKADGDVLTGTGNLHLTGNVTTSAGGAAECNGPVDLVATSVVTGTLVGEGPEAVLRIVLRSTTPAGATVDLTCTGLLGGASTTTLGADGHAERFGEPLGQFDLPAAGGTVNISKTAAVGGVLQVTVEGAFVVTRAEG